MPPLVEDVLIRRSERLTTMRNTLVFYSRPNMLMHRNLWIQLEKICMVTFACNAIENFLKKSGLQFLKIARHALKELLEKLLVDFLPSRNFSPHHWLFNSDSPAIKHVNSLRKVLKPHRLVSSGKYDSRDPKVWPLWINNRSEQSWYTLKVSAEMWFTRAGDSFRSAAVQLLLHHYLPKPQGSQLRNLPFSMNIMDSVLG